MATGDGKEGKDMAGERRQPHERDGAKLTEEVQCAVYREAAVKED